jgi:hypothetical protein
MSDMDADAATTMSGKLSNFTHLGMIPPSRDR